MLKKVNNKPFLIGAVLVCLLAVLAVISLFLFPDNNEDEKMIVSLVSGAYVNEDVYYIKPGSKVEFSVEHNFSANEYGEFFEAKIVPAVDVYYVFEDVSYSFLEIEDLNTYFSLTQDEDSIFLLIPEDLSLENAIKVHCGANVISFLNEADVPRYKLVVTSPLGECVCEVLLDDYVFVDGLDVPDTVEFGGVCR